MSHFASYNTSDSDNPSPQLPLQADASITAMSLVGAKESLIVGMVISDQPGSLVIQQSFDNQNWDVQNTTTVEASTEVGTGIEINQEIYAPYVQVTYQNIGSETQTYLRLFLRATGTRGT